MRFNIKSLFPKFPFKQKDTFLFHDSRGVVYNPTIEQWLVKILYRCYVFNGNLPSGSPENQKEMLVTILTGCRLNEVDKLEEILSIIDSYRGRKVRKSNGELKLSRFVSEYFKGQE